jgi:single-strand DNA-binding protein
VRGRLKSHTYEKDGQNRVSVDLEVDEVGPSLRYATAKVTKTQRVQGGQAQPDQWSGRQQEPAQQGGWNAGPVEDAPPF